MAKILQQLTGCLSKLFLKFYTGGAGFFCTFSVVPTTLDELFHFHSLEQLETKSEVESGLERVISPNVHAFCFHVTIFFPPTCSVDQT